MAAHGSSLGDNYEIFYLLVMFFGIIVAILVPTKPLSYAVIMLAGFAAGKLIYNKRYKHEHKTDLAYFIVDEFPYLIMIIAFLAGYILGAYNVSRKALLILFLISFGISYYFHLKKVFVYK